jgi:hypothetical protein
LLLRLQKKMSINALYIHLSQEQFWSHYLLPD